MKNTTNLLLLKITLTGTVLLATFNLQNGLAQQRTPTHKTAASRDGQHDFDFNFGKWRTHIQSLQISPKGPATWVKMEGIVTVRKVWDGRASLEEIEADGPGGHFEGTTLFLYNPQSHQWSQTFASSADGTLETSTIGEFHNGRGELYSHVNRDGKMVMVRDTWSDIAANSHKFEEATSDDGGKTWQPHFIANLERIK
jgi:hypothetical protein